MPGNRGSEGSNRDRQRDALIVKLRRYIRSHGRHFLADKNITSIGIGYKIRGGNKTNDVCLQFTVASKPDSVSTLESLDTVEIPKTITVDGEEIPTDVIQRSFKPSFLTITAEETNSRTDRHDPLIPGISISHPSGSAGTLGLIVFDRKTGDPCILSNWHVLHLSEGKIGDRVVQPGPHDDNDVQDNEAGTLLRSHLGAAGDCAIARIESRDFDREILDLNVHPTQLARADLGDRVVKSGRTTGVTQGLVRRIDVMAFVEYPGVGAKEIGGFEIGPLDDAAPDHEISTGGDSGAAWLIADDDGSATDVLVGLHFAGEGSTNPDEHALACNAHSVFKKLNIAISAPATPEEGAPGYNPRFLSEEVRTPELTQTQRDDSFSHNDSHLIDYTHYSVNLSKARGLARFAAWNIDGSRIRRLKTRGFRLDRSVPREMQHGNELYENNPLDKGHIARRADLCWGPRSEAERANSDSYFYTNCAPQHRNFNQSGIGGIWGEVEDALFEDTEIENLRVSVIAGPVFDDNDPVHRGVPIPSDFWKVLAYADSDDHARFKVRAFVLTQTELLTNIEVLELEPFRMFQVSLAELERITDLGFESLKEFDTFQSDIESVARVEELGRSKAPQVRRVTSRNNLFGG